MRTENSLRIADDLGTIFSKIFLILFSGVIYPSILPVCAMNASGISVTIYRKLVHMYIRHTFSLSIFDRGFRVLRP